MKEFLVSDLTICFYQFLRFKSNKISFPGWMWVLGLKRISLWKMFEYEHTSKYSVSAEPGNYS
jgi:hypothetical protein